MLTEPLSDVPPPDPLHADAINDVTAAMLTAISARQRIFRLFGMGPLTFPLWCMTAALFLERSDERAFHEVPLSQRVYEQHRHAGHHDHRILEQRLNRLEELQLL